MCFVLSCCRSQLHGWEKGGDMHLLYGIVHSPSQSVQLKKDVFNGQRLSPTLCGNCTFPGISPDTGNFPLIFRDFFPLGKKAERQAGHQIGTTFCFLDSLNHPDRSGCVPLC